MHPLDPTCCRTCRRRHTAPVPCRKQDCPPPVLVYTAARRQESRKAVRGLTFGLVSTTMMASLLFPKAWTQHSPLWVPPPRLSGASDFPGSRPYTVDCFSGGSHAQEAGCQSLQPRLKLRPLSLRPRPRTPPPRPHLELCDGQATTVPLLRAEAVERAADENRHRGRRDPRHLHLAALCSGPRSGSAASHRLRSGRRCFWDISPAPGPEADQYKRSNKHDRPIAIVLSPPLG